VEPPLRAAVNAESAIAVVDRRGHVLIWNSDAERLTGLPARDVRGGAIPIAATRRSAAEGEPSRDGRTAFLAGLTGCPPEGFAILLEGPEGPIPLHAWSSPASEPDRFTLLLRPSEARVPSPAVRLHCLSELAEDLACAGTLEELESLVAEKANSVFGYGACIRMLLSDGCAEVQATAGSDRSAEPPESRKRPSTSDPLLEAIRTGKQVWPERSNDADGLPAGSAAMASRSVGACTMWSGGRILGALCLERSGTCHQCEEDRPLLALVAAQCAQAVERIRKRAARPTEQRETRDRDEWFRIAQELMPDGFIIYRPLYGEDGRIKDLVFEYQNPGAGRLNGTDSDEVVGKTLLEVFPGARDTKFFRTYCEVLETGGPAEFEECYRGETVTKETWYRIVAVPLKGTLAVLSQDITPRKQAENAMTEAALFPKENPNPVLRMTPSGDIPYANAAALALLQCSGEGADACARRALLEIVRGALQEGTRFEAEVLCGQSRVFLFDCVPFPERGYANLYGRDITDRKMVEEALKEASHRLKYHVENSPLAVVEFDALFHITRWSQEAEKVFGWTAEETLNRGIHDLPWIHPDDMASVDEISRAMMAGVSVSNVHPNRNLRKDGSVIWCEWYNSALLDERRQLVSILSLVLDVTDRVTAQQALAESDRRKDEFLAMLAHELRNPLAAIANATALIDMRTQDQPSLHRTVTILDRQVKHTARLVDDLLDVSRITRGVLELRKTPLNLTETILSAAETIQPQMESRQHRLSVLVPENPVWIEGDATRLEQVVLNLLGNAAKFTDPGGAVQLAMGVEDGDAVIRISDNGQGIPEHMLPRVFELFEQADRSLSRSKGGLGIGLTLARTLTQMHGGSIRAFSEGPGLGSLFVVRLPLPDEGDPPALDSHRDS